MKGWMFEIILVRIMNNYVPDIPTKEAQFLRWRKGAMLHTRSGIL